MQVYSNPDREPDPTALPDCETFFVSSTEFLLAENGSWLAEMIEESEDDPFECAKALEGWYWWACSPGCLPDSEPCGPFETEAEAIADAQST